MNLLKALATVSSMTLLSRILGYVRDAVIANRFGVSIYTDAFFVAFKIPNLLRRLFAEGAFSQAFVPILGEYKSRKTETETKELLDRVATLLFFALIFITALGVALAPIIIYITAPGFSAHAEKFDVTVLLLRITFPYILFISLVALAAGILNTWSRFAVPAFTPVLLNVSMIAAALWLAPYFHPPVLALAIGVFLGGVLQLLLQIPFLMRIRMLPRFSLQSKDEGVWRIIKLMGPAILGVSVGQISLVINNIFASFLPNGSVSWLYYADRLMEFPTGMLGVALGTILLPSLARCYASTENEEYSRLLDWGLRLCLLLALPAAVAMAVISIPLITTLFQHGRFNVQDALMTQQALIAYSIGLLGLIMVKILAPGFYARQNIKTPVKIALITLVATQLMNIIFVGFLKHAGLALSISLGACLNAGLLFYGLRKGKIYQPQPGWFTFVGKIILALTLMVVVMWFTMGPPSAWFMYHKMESVIRLTGIIIVSSATYFGALWLLGFRLKNFVKRAVE